MSEFFARLHAAVDRPRDARRYVLAVIRGHYYRLKFRLLGRRFSAGRGLRVYGRLRVRGPGRVIFGEQVIVWGVVTPWTYHADAVIRVGERTTLSGTRMGCATSITLGREGLFADCRILDTDFHSIAVNRRDDHAPVRTLPVRIGDNVWISSQVGIMPGTTIGENSVISFGAVCSGTFPANVIIAGNPARIAGKIPGVACAGGELRTADVGSSTANGVQ